MESPCECGIELPCFISLGIIIIIIIIIIISTVRLIESRRLAGHIARVKKSRNALKILTGKLTGKKLLGRPRRSWEDNIRMDV